MHMLFDLPTRDFIGAFLDDVWCYSKFIDEYFDNLKFIYKPFSKVNFSLNFHKCQFLKTELVFLGHIVEEVKLVNVNSAP